MSLRDCLLVFNLFIFPFCAFLAHLCPRHQKVLCPQHPFINPLRKTYMPLIHLDEPKHSAENCEKQAKQILKIKPDVILFEFPQESKPGSDYNRFLPKNKPYEKFNATKKGFRKISKLYPWSTGEIAILEAIETLWKQGHQVLLFNMDGPQEITRLCDQTDFNKTPLLFEIINYFREQHMIRTIKKIQRRYPSKKIIVLCSNWHWKRLQFLLRTRNKNKIIKPFLPNTPKPTRAG